jgi:hypothetical protein
VFVNLVNIKLEGENVSASQMFRECERAVVGSVRSELQRISNGEDGGNGCCRRRSVVIAPTMACW